MLTISAGNCTNICAEVFVIPYVNCCSNCYYNFSSCGIFENMTSSTPILIQHSEQGKLMAALNTLKYKSKTRVLLENVKC